MICFDHTSTLLGAAAQQTSRSTVAEALEATLQLTQGNR